MKTIFVTIIAAIALSGCEYVQTKALGEMSDLIEKGKPAGNKAKVRVQKEVARICDFLVQHPEERQALKDWVWVNPETGEIVDATVSFNCPGDAS